jgi:hypothetical protein
MPYGSLVPLRIDGLLTAGRIISQTHEADMWMRGIYCCAMTGQSASVAAALAARGGLTPRGLSATALQQELRRQGLDLGAPASHAEAGRR